MIFITLLLGLVGVLYLLSQYTIWRSARPKDLPRVLMYHSIADGERSGMNTPPSLFARHLQYLQKHQRTACTISRLVEDTPDRAVAITFDDGFANNYTVAFALLKQYQMPATVYLTPEIEGIARLTQAQIQEMQDSGLIEFGAHTLTHPNLTTLPDEAAYAEIHQSKLAVEAITGVTCRSFAYPYGRFAPRHVEMLQQAGFTSAVTVKKAIAPLGDLYRIPRISVNGKANMLQFHIAFMRGRYRV